MPSTNTKDKAFLKALNPKIQKPRGDSIKLLLYFVFCVLYFVFLCFIFCIFVFYILYFIFCILYFVFLYFVFLCNYNILRRGII
jgi:Flp pilus assembly protein TadB